MKASYKGYHTKTVGLIKQKIQTQHNTYNKKVSSRDFTVGYRATDAAKVYYRRHDFTSTEILFF